MLHVQFERCLDAFRHGHTCSQMRHTRLPGKARIDPNDNGLPSFGVSSYFGSLQIFLGKINAAAAPFIEDNIVFCCICCDEADQRNPSAYVCAEQMTVLAHHDAVHLMSEFGPAEPLASVLHRSKVLGGCVAASIMAASPGQPPVCIPVDAPTPVITDMLRLLYSGNQWLKLALLLHSNRKRFCEVQALPCRKAKPLL